VILKLSIQNTTRDSTVLDLGDDFRGGLLVTIITPAGTVLHRPPIDADGLAAVGRVQIQPGGVYKRKYAVNEWFDFDSPGTYGIGISLRFAITVGHRSVSLPRQTFQTITIDARDEAALRRRCETLLAPAAKIRDLLAANIYARLGVDLVEDADQAMRALSFVRDPVAIPYLAQAITWPIVDFSAVRSLDKFSTPEAVAALISYAKGNPGSSSFVRGMLLRKAKEVQDPTLQKQISDGLGEPSGK
jgi:hypothetical protein